ncbi:MAG: histidine phosphatase family protein [Clostridia bacterium]|nr:histidine phosphatase family protein [Clostridia bacterium]
MLFFLVRHGDPDYKNDTLTPLGWRQAEALSRRFAIHGLDRIYASPLGRAKDTAKPTAEVLHLPVEVEEWASESLAWHDIAGEVDGRNTWIFNKQNTILKTEETMKMGWDHWYDAECFAPIRDRCVEGFERVQKASDDFFARQGYVREGTRYRIERPNDDRVALFCHQGFSMEFLPILLQIPPQYTFASFDFTHTCVSIFEFANNADGYTAPRCLALADVSHIYEARLPFLFNNEIKL